MHEKLKLSIFGKYLILRHKDIKGARNINLLIFTVPGKVRESNLQPASEYFKPALVFKYSWTSKPQGLTQTTHGIPFTILGSPNFRRHCIIFVLTDKKPNQKA